MDLDEALRVLASLEKAEVELKEKFELADNDFNPSKGPNAHPKIP